MCRMSVDSEENFEGKLLIQFIALELLSYIKKQMDENNLYKNYTMQSLLDELDIIEYYQQPGRTHHLSEMTKNNENSMSLWVFRSRHRYKMTGLQVKKIINKKTICIIDT